MGSDLSAAAQGAMPGVVNLRAARIVRGSPPGPRGPFESDPFFQFFSGEAFFHRLRVPREHREQSLGSGVLVWPEGIILTSHRVVAGAAGLRARLADRREVEARLVGADPQTDLAVLRIPGGPFPLLPLGDSDLVRVGEPVLAVGNPYGLGQTAAQGIISAVGRGNLGLADYEDFLQTDAAITPGSVGGALVNARGEVIGITTAISGRGGGPRGLGFAIPANMARAILEQILERGRVVRGYLGVAVQELSPGVARAFGLGELAGVLVTEVDPGGPPVHAGLQPGDILRSLNGIPVESPGQFRNLVAALAPGSPAALTILRDGQPLALSGAIAEQPDDAAGLADSSRRLGLTLAETTPELLRQLALPAESRGVLVAAVDPDGPAHAAGLRPGDLILEVNRLPVRSTRDLAAALRQAGGRELLLLVNRGGRTAPLTLALPDRG